MTSARLRGFPPVIDGQCRALILGSFPSERSLAKAQYYGHPQNQFWRLVGHVIDAALQGMEYDGRLAVLLAHGIGLWDVIGACERTGSLDSNIRQAQQNSFHRVTRIATGLRCICFNGKTAGRFEPVFAEQGYKTFVLPSSSPANTVAYSVKLRAWRQALGSRDNKGKRITGHRSLVTGHGFQC
jgi:double-stranded uracil-DNA glycosylase